MDTLKNMLSPLGMNTNALQDTLVFTLLFRVNSCSSVPLETSRHRWDSRNSEAYICLCLEWFRRLCACPLYLLSLG